MQPVTICTLFSNNQVGKADYPFGITPGNLEEDNAFDEFLDKEGSERARDGLGWHNRFAGIG